MSPGASPSSRTQAAHRVASSSFCASTSRANSGQSLVGSELPSAFEAILRVAAVGIPSLRCRWGVLFSQLGVVNVVPMSKEILGGGCDSVECVGLLGGGSLAVTGTPEALKARPEVNAPDTRRIEIETPEPARMLAWIRQQRWCLGATIFGQSVHTVVPRDKGDAEVLAEARRGGFPAAGIREIHPSLEDVFVKLTEDAARARGEAAA